MVNNIKYLLFIIILFLVIILQRNCNNKKTIVDPIIIIDTVYKIQPDTIIYNQIITDTIFDTVFIVKDYQAKKIFIDTIYFYQKSFAILTDTVSRNRIINRQLKFSYYKPIPKNQYYIGLGINGSAVGFGAGPQFAFINKKQHLYVGGYDIINKRVFISVFWKIKL